MTRQPPEHTGPHDEPTVQPTDSAPANSEPLNSQSSDTAAAVGNGARIAQAKLNSRGVPVIGGLTMMGSGQSCGADGCV